MSRGLVALLLLVTLVVSSGSSALVSWAVTSSALGPGAADGSPGADASPGASGEAGADGSDGADGTDGTDGADGVDGRAGLTGSAGALGAQGAPGPQGPQGIPGADAMLATVEVAVPDSQPVVTAGGEVALSGSTSVASAPAVVLTWQMTIEPQSSALYLQCGFRDTTTSLSHAFALWYVPTGAARTVSGTELVAFPEDAALVLYCSDGYGGTQSWDVTDLTIWALTFAT